MTKIPKETKPAKKKTNQPFFKVQKKKNNPQLVEKPNTKAKKKHDDAAFWEWWKLVAGFEGSFEGWKKNPANKKHDKGGETNWGVTKKNYMAFAKGMGLSPTDEGFAAMTPEQAMLFGRKIWNASGANKTNNTGVGLVLADWFWGGINLKRFKKLLLSKGIKAEFNEGRPTEKTIAQLNRLNPAELISLMTKEKAAQYNGIAARDPTQEVFLDGWLKRNRERKAQAWKFAFPLIPPVSIPYRSQVAIDKSRFLLNGEIGASQKEKRSAMNKIWVIIASIDGHLKRAKEKKWDADPKTLKTLKFWKGKLLMEASRLTNSIAMPKPAKSNIPNFGLALRALEQSRVVLKAGTLATDREKRETLNQLWSVVGDIEKLQKVGFANSETDEKVKAIKGRLLKQITILMDKKARGE